ncbi:MAG: universal stress protein [Deltaproteobacteria bacterium]|nr:universal stress protein [Kofleriaceae bacterium]
MTTTATRTIVCGTDFTESARFAAEIAAALAAAMKAELRLVHVDDTANVVLSDAGFRDRIHAAALAALEGESARLRAEHRVVVTPQLLSGSPAAELAHFARAANALLIVVAAQGPTASIFRVGGTAERVAQAAHVPVLLVRETEPLRAWLRGGTLAVAAMIGEDAASDRAVEWLRLLREVGACDVHALQAYYVGEAAHRYGLSPRPLVVADPEIEEYVRRDIARRLATLSGAGSVTCHAVLALGRLADHLIDHPAVRDAGLIVVGNHRARGLARLSSVAAGVVHLAPVSLLVVPADAPSVAVAPWPTIRSVLVPTDFSEHAAAAIRHAFGLVAATGGVVTLLHVVERGAEGNDEAALAELRTLVPSSLPAGVSTSVLVERHGEAAPAILEVAARIGADCIAIASHGRSGLRALFLGSVAKGVIQGARRPVLVVRPPVDV